MAAKLMIHCGGYQADIAKVRSVKTPAPSGDHYPVPHIEVVDMFKARCEQAGYKILQEEHALATEGMNYFGVFETDIQTSEYSVVLGLRNSHNKSFALGYLLGSNVFVCDNLAFHAEVKIQRKHTKFIMRDIEQVLGRALGKVYDLHTDTQTRIQAYKDHPVDIPTADHAIVDLIRQRAISSSDVIKVVKDFEEVPDDERNVWTLYNSVTQTATKGTNIFQLPRRTEVLHGICDEVAGLHKRNFKLAA